MPGKRRRRNDDPAGAHTSLHARRRAAAHRAGSWHPRAVSKKPPLEVVRVVRARAVDDAAEKLRVAAARADAARALAEQARLAEETQRRDAADAHAREAAAVAGALSPRALADLAAFEHAAARRTEQAAAHASDAEDRALTIESAADRARALTAEARHSLEGVEAHQARWRAAHDAAEQTRSDESAEESFAARLRRR